MSTDPRGPERTIAKVDTANGKALITLDCGHIRELASHFSYRTGDRCRCFPCGKGLPTFAQIQAKAADPHSGAQP